MESQDVQESMVHGTGEFLFFTASKNQKQRGSEKICQVAASLNGTSISRHRQGMAPRWPEKTTPFGVFLWWWSSSSWDAVGLKLCPHFLGQLISIDAKNQGHLRTKICPGMQPHPAADFWFKPLKPWKPRTMEGKRGKMLAPNHQDQTPEDCIQRMDTSPSKMGYKMVQLWPSKVIRRFRSTRSGFPLQFQNSAKEGTDFYCSNQHVDHLQGLKFGDVPLQDWQGEWLMTDHHRGAQCWLVIPPVIAIHWYPKNGFVWK